MLAGRSGNSRLSSTLRLLFLLFLAPAFLAASVSAQIVAPGSTWKYLDDGSDQGTGWRAVAFDDSSWSSGPAQLGYGDGDEATVVSFGPDPNNKYVTTYFRHSFPVVDPSSVDFLTLRILRDDGAVVYLNGAEVTRQNMPAGPILFNTFAASTVAGATENAFFTVPVDPALLFAGQNVLAVEVHQRTVTSSDISFDLELNEDPGSLVVRGPYLQMGTSSEVTVRWRTALPTDSRVQYGPAPGNLDQMTVDATSTTEHEVVLSGLSADTTYFYSIGTTTTVLAGADADHFFTTAPLIGTTIPVRAWVLGDCGTANANARAVRDAYFAFAGATHTNLWLMLGDNAYNDGTDTEYQAAVFDTYPEMLRKSVLWSTRGNHERNAGTYYGMFNFPAAGEAGGLPSGTEAYYSFDFANIHFICLDSEGTNRSATGAMATWLEADLASTSQRWIVAFWHHPPYTKGSHDSDNPFDSGGRMRDMRQNILPILEAGGVDLTLTGHSHSYERSFLIGGHYGLSPSFNASHLFDGGDGREDGDGVYQKSTAPNSGAVYCCAGSSGRISGGSLNHPAMFTSQNRLGSLVLDFNGDRLDVRFIDDGEVVRDYFTLLTGDPIPPVISSVAPATGPVRGGTSVTVSGSDFAPNAEIQLDGSPVGPTSRSATSMVFDMPAGMAAGQQVDVAVVQPSGTATAADAFTYGENAIAVEWQGDSTVGGAVTFTIYGPSNKDVALAVGTPGTLERVGITFCAEPPFDLIRRFTAGFNLGPNGQVDILWDDLPGPAFQDWNAVGVIRETFGVFSDLGCTTITVFP